MITAPTPCYFVVKAEGETASSIISELSPSTSNDIVTAILVSADFDSDILAIISMETATTRIVEGIDTFGLKTQTKYNPLYIPGKMSSIDEMLDTSPGNEGMRFIGLEGNPFLLKSVEITHNDESVLTAKVEYHPFEIPGYSEISESNSAFKLN